MLDLTKITIQPERRDRVLVSDSDIGLLFDEIIKLRQALTEIQWAVDQQAEDEGLWSMPLEGLQPVAEAYLQQELRKLHNTIEMRVNSLIEKPGK